MKKHLLYYLTLFALLVGGVVVVQYSAGHKQVQLSIVVLMGIIYAFWGIFHHKMHHSLRVKIVLEYISVALLGFAAILFILKGGL